MDSSENGTSQRVLTKCGLRHDRMFRRGDDMSKAAAFCLLALATLSAQSSAPFSPFVAVSWCNIGPASTGTRIVDLAVVEKDPRVICAATASSGVWKTTDAGISWAPTFENENTVALRAVAVSQSNPQIVWVATGEPNDPQRVYFLQTPISVSTETENWWEL